MLTLFHQKVDATDWFLHLQTFRHLSSFHVPEPDSLIIGTADQALASKQEGGTKVGVSGQEANALRDSVPEVGLAMMKRTIKRIPETGWAERSAEKVEKRTTHQELKAAGAGLDRKPLWQDNDVAKEKGAARLVATFWIPRLLSRQHPCMQCI